MSRKDAILKLRVTEELKTEAEKIAQMSGETLAVIVRQALREYIDRCATKTSAVGADQALRVVGSSQQHEPGAESS